MAALLRPFQQRLQWRFTVYVLLLVLIPSIGIGAFLTLRWTQTIQDDLNKGEELNIKLEEARLETFLTNSQQDISLLANDPNIVDLIEAVNVSSGQDFAFARRDGELALLNFARERNFYAQIRLLDTEGNEIIRINRIDDSVRVVPEVELQNKSGSEYFTEALRLGAGEIYISEINLNREGTPPQIQLIDGQYLPVLRYSTPIYFRHPISSQNILGGVVVTNIFADEMFSRLEKDAEDAEVFVLNSDGYYLYNTIDPKLNFGFEDGVDVPEIGNIAGATFQSRLSSADAADIFNDGTTDQGEITTNDDNILHVARITPPNAPEDFFWVLGTTRDSGVILEPIQDVIRFSVIGAIILALAATVVTLIITRSFTRPVEQLSAIADGVAGGNLTMRFEGDTSRRDEIGTLGTSFNKMTHRLEDIVGSLEQRVTARTRDIQSVVEISNQIASILDLDRLLQDVSDLTKDRFDLYHAHIYLMNDTKDKLVLRAGAGYVGRQMVAEKRVIALDNEKSVVATAARTRKAQIINDVSTVSTFLAHPLLPETRAELAVVLVAHGQVVGVMDVQSERKDFFEAESLYVYEVLGGQIATAIDNASLFGQSMKRASELQTVAEVGADATSTLDIGQLLINISNLTRDRFNLYHAHIYLLDDTGETLVLAAGAGSAGRKMVKRGHSIRLDNPTSIVARAARDQQPVVVNDVTQSPDFLANPLLPDTRSEMAIPLIVNEEAIGVLDVQGDVFDRFTDEDIRVKSTLASQIAVAVQNAQTFTLAQEARDEARILYEISNLINTAEDPRDLIEAMRRHLIHEEADSVTLNLFDASSYEEAKNTHVLADWRKDGATQAGQMFPLETFPFMTSIKRHQINVFDNIETDDRMDAAAAQLLVQLGVGAMLLAPLVVRGRWMGTFTVSTPGIYHHSERQIRLMRGAADQLAASLDRMQLAQQMEKRATELATVAEVSAEAATTLNAEELLFTVSNLTKDRFNLYHAHIYLLDEAGENLVLAAGAGEAGRIMVEEGRSIPLNSEQSVVARAARSRRGVVVNDVTQSPNFLANPLLPDTKSEMAIPMLVGRNLVGVLDVQGNVFNRFTTEDVQIKTTLADQIAVAVQNARFFQETQRRAIEMETVAKVSAEAATNLDIDRLLQDVAELTKDSFNLYHAHIYLLNETGGNLILAAGAGVAGRQMKAEGRSIAISNQHSLVAQAARNRQGVIANNVAEHEDFLPNPLLPETRSELAVPMIAGDNLIGVLDVQASTINRFKNDDIEIQLILASQVAIAVQNARSFDDIQRNAQELAAIAEVSSQITQILDLQELLQTVTDMISRTFGYYHIHIYLLDEEGDELHLMAGGGEIPCEVKGKFHLSISEKSPVTRVVHTGEEVIIDDLHDDPDYEFNELLPDSNSALIVPLTVGQQRVGVLEVQQRAVAGFRQDDVRVMEAIANQIAIGIQNARSFAQTQKRAIEMETVAQVSAEASSNLDIDVLLQDVADLTQHSFDLYHAHIYLFDEVSQRLVLAAGAGDAGRAMKQRGHSIALDHEHSVVAKAAREKAAVIQNDVTESAFFLPNPLLPDTLSEMAIPMMIADEVLGILDVQATSKDRFTKEDVRIKSTLAAQVAIGVQNARSYKLTQKRAIEMETVAEVSAEAASNLDVDDLLQDVADLTQARFDLYHAHIYLMDSNNERLFLAAGAGEVGRDMKERGHSIAIENDHSIVARAAREKAAVVQNDVTESAFFLPNPFLPDTLSEMAIPLMVGDRVLGVLDVQATVKNRFTKEDIQIKSTLASQVAIGVQNARFFAQTQKRAIEMETVAQVSLEASSSLNTDKLLQDVVDLTKERFDLYHAHIYLLDEQGENLKLTAGAGEAGRMMMQEGRSISFSNQHSLVAQAARTREGVIANDVSRSPDFLPNPLLPQTRSEMSIPMLAGGNLIGVLDVQADIVDRFTDEDVRIKTTLASQVAVAIQNARTFREVQAAREEVERILNSSIDMIGSATFEGYFVTLNPSWERVTGFTNDELKAKPFIEFVHPDDVDMTLAEAGKLAAGAATVSFENRYLCKDGSYRWIAWNSSPDPERELIHFIARDITATKQADEHLRKNAVELQTVAEVSSQAATELDVTKLLKAVSDLTKDRFDLYHAHIYLLDEEDETLHLAAGAGEAGDLMVKDGHAIPLNQKNSLVAQVAREHQGVVMNDVRKKKGFLANPLLPDTLSEMAIPMIVGDNLIGVLDVQSARINRFTDEDIRIKSTLATQVAIAVQNARLYEEQVQTTEQLREVDRLKSEFLASMSHELRTPLNSIIGYAEVILDGLDGPINEEMEEDVQAIHGSGKLLLALINDILDLAKIEAGQLDLDFEPVVVESFIKETLETARVLVKNKPVELRLELQSDLPDVMADRVRLQQIMNNLVSNAAKFTEEGDITVCAQRENGMVQFSVRDSGMGIAAEQQALIFERFRQADQSSTRKAGGTGLGLAITRQLVELHDGHIWVDSIIGQGSTFCFTLPVANGDVKAS